MAVIYIQKCREAERGRKNEKVCWVYIGNYGVARSL